MKRVIVTGANGFVGAAVVRELLRQGVEVHAVGHAGNFSRLEDCKKLSKYSWDMNDIKGLARILPSAQYDLFYHFAWQGSAGAARADTKLQLQNAQWTVDALEMASKLGCKRFVGAGSIMEHEAIAAIHTQGHKPGLGTIYGGSKLLAHIMCQAVAAKLGIDLLWGEITNAYGVGEDSPRMVNTVLKKCLQGESPELTEGKQNYDFVYIDEVARAFFLIGEKGKPFHRYLIGSSNARPLREFLLEMKETVAPELEFHFGAVPFSGISLPLMCFDCSETEKDTGFGAEVSFKEGIKRMIP